MLRIKYKAWVALILNIFLHVWILEPKCLHLDLKMAYYEIVFSEYANFR